MYVLSFAYIGIRFAQHRHAVRRLRRMFGEEGVCHVLPEFHWFRWSLIVERQDRFFTGKIVNGIFAFEDEYVKEEHNPMIQATLFTREVRDRGKVHFPVCRQAGAGEGHRRPADIIRKLPEPLNAQVHWLIVGDCLLLADFRRAAPGNVTFTGYLGGGDLACAYASADLFVFPSSTETFGNVA